jgi:hypothetical protein
MRWVCFSKIKNIKKVIASISQKECSNIYLVKFQGQYLNPNLVVTKQERLIIVSVELIFNPYALTLILSSLVVGGLSIYICLKLDDSVK